MINQKGFAPVLIVVIAGIALVAGVIVFLSFGNRKNDQVQVTPSPKLFESTTSPVLGKSYPVYPQAVLAGTEKAPSCEDAPARGECGQTASIYQSKDSWDKVLGWYESDSSNSGWKLVLIDNDGSDGIMSGYLEYKNVALYTEFNKNTEGTSIKIYKQ